MENFLGIHYKILRIIMNDKWLHILKTPILNKIVVLKSDTYFYTSVYLVILQYLRNQLLSLKSRQEVLIQEIIMIMMMIMKCKNMNNLQFLFFIIPTSKYLWQTTAYVNYLHT